MGSDMRIARGALGAVVAGAVAIGATMLAPGAAQAVPGPAPGVVRWSPSLGAGDAVGVEVVRGSARLTTDRARSAEAALSLDGHGDARSPGLLTLPAQRMARPVDRVEATVDLAGGSAADGVAVDVRGLRTGGGWTEWLTAEAAVRGPGD